jgi:hypothetical protein
LENTGLAIVPPIRKRNCNLPFTNAAPGQPGDGVGEEAFFGGNLCQANGSGSVSVSGCDVDPITVNVYHTARNPLIGQVQISGSQVERGRIIFGRAEIVEVRQLHQIRIEPEARHLAKFGIDPRHLDDVAGRKQRWILYAEIVNVKRYRKKVFA